MFSSIALTLLAGLTAVSAQETSVSEYPPVVPSNIPDATRVAWCNTQLASCGLLCQDQNSGLQYTNNCDPDDLTYQCICHDGKVPNATQYSQTLPYYICTQQVINCVNACGSDNICGENCKANKRCGASDPKPPKSTSTSKGSKSTPTSDSSTVAFDGFGGDSTETGTASATATGGSSGGAINLKNAGNGIAAFELYSAAVLIASFGLSIVAFLQ